MIDPHGSVTVPERLKKDAPFLLIFTGPQVVKILVVTAPAFLLGRFFLEGKALLFVIGVGIAVGLGLAFFAIDGLPVERWLRNTSTFMRQRRRFAGRLTPSRKKAGWVPSRDFLPLDRSLTDGVLVTRRPGLTPLHSTIVEIEPHAYHLLPVDRQQVALAAFAKILRANPGGLQIISTAGDYNPRDFLAGFRRPLRDAESRIVQEATLNFLLWFDLFTARNSVLDRRFHVIAPNPGPGPPSQGNPPQPAFLKARRASASAANIIAGTAKSLSRRARQLDSTAIARLIQATVDPRPRREKLYLKDALTKPAAAIALDKIRVPTLTVHPSHLQVGQQFARTYVAQVYPEEVPVSWLYDVLFLEQPVTVSLHYQPIDPARMAATLKKQRTTIAVSIQEGQKAGRQTLELEQRLHEIEDQIRSVSRRSTEFYEVTALFVVFADNLTALDDRSETLKQTLASKSIHIQRERFNQHDAWLSALPLGINRLAYHSQTMALPAATATMPFITPSLRDPGGILWGFDESTLAPIVWDRWAGPNYNSLIAGSSGSGKSYAVKLEILRAVGRNPHAWVLIADPLREFGDVMQVIGGQVARIGTANGILNPLELHESVAGGGTWRDTMAFLTGFYEALLDHPKRSIIGMMLDASILAYENNGITADPATHTRRPPILTDVLTALETYTDSDDADLARDARMVIRELKPLLNTTLQGLNGQSSIDLTKRRLCFDLQEMPEALYNLYMFVVMHLIESSIVQDTHARKLCIIDEAWYLLGRPGTARALHDLVRHTRHYNTGLICLAQNAIDFCGSETGRAILANCYTQLLFRQQTVPAEVVEAFTLTPEQVDLLKGFSEYHPGEKVTHTNAIWGLGSARFLVRLISSPDEDPLITTKPSDLAARDGSQ